jgi:hypothetical protein
MSVPELMTLTRKHWNKYLPNKVRELQASGELNEAMFGAASLAQMEIDHLKKVGYSEQEAREVALRQFVLLPEETDEDEGTRTGRHGSRISKEPAGDDRPGRGPSSEVTPVETPNIPAVNFRITDELNRGQGSETDKSNDDIAAITSLRHRACEPPRQVPSDR